MTKSCSWAELKLTIYNNIQPFPSSFFFNVLHFLYKWMLSKDSCVVNGHCTSTWPLSLYLLDHWPLTLTSKLLTLKQSFEVVSPLLPVGWGFCSSVWEQTNRNTHTPCTFADSGTTINYSSFISFWEVYVCAVEEKKSLHICFCFLHKNDIMTSS